MIKKEVIKVAKSMCFPSEYVGRNLDLPYELHQRILRVIDRCSLAGTKLISYQVIALIVDDYFREQTNPLLRG